MITLYLHLAKTLTKLPENFKMFLNFRCFFNNFLVLNSDKCQFMTLGTPNTLLKYKCKNNTIRNSVSKKLLGVIIDKKFDFTEHLNTVCKKNI